MSVGQGGGRCGGRRWGRRIQRLQLRPEVEGQWASTIEIRERATSVKSFVAMASWHQVAPPSSARCRRYTCWSLCWLEGPGSAYTASSWLCLIDKNCSANRNDFGAA